MKKRTYWALVDERGRLFHEITIYTKREKYLKLAARKMDAELDLPPDDPRWKVVKVTVEMKQP